MTEIYIDILGWFCTVMVLLGFYLNAKKIIWCFPAWIIGDISWIWYSYLTDTLPHAGQSLVIIMLSCYGWYNWTKQNNK